MRGPHPIYIYIHLNLNIHLSLPKLNPINNGIFVISSAQVVVTSKQVVEFNRSPLKNSRAPTSIFQGFPLAVELRGLFLGNVHLTQKCLIILGGESFFFNEPEIYLTFFTFKKTHGIIVAGEFVC